MPRRFTRWLRAGVREGIFAMLARDRDNDYLMIDSSIVRAHAQAARMKWRVRYISPESEAPIRG